MKKNLACAALALLSLIFVARIASAAPINLGKPPKPSHDFVNTLEWEVVAEADFPGVRGKFTVQCYSDDKDISTIDLKGLPRRAVFTAWLATSLKDTAVRGGVGKAPHSFRSSGGGSAQYGSPLETCPLSEWRWLEIRMHPDGDPTHMANSVRVGRARLVGQ